MSKKKLTIIIASLVVLVLAVTGGVFFFLSQNNNAQERLQSSSTGKQIIATLDAAEHAPSTITVAPASQKWWDILTKTLPQNQQLEQLTYDKVSNNATYLATSISGGGMYSDYYKFGMNTMMVIYETHADVLVTAETMPLGVPYFVSGNLLILPPKEAFADVDYVLTALDNTAEVITHNDLKLEDKALMSVDLHSLILNTAKSVEGISEAQFIRDFGTLFGLQENSGWVGTSTDGVTWEGSFYNLTRLPSITEIAEYYNDAARMILVDGREIRPEELENEEDYSGFVDPHQGYALQVFSVRTNHVAIGANTYDLSYPGENPGPLPVEEGVYQIVMNPNPFISYMKDMKMTYPFTNVELMTITLLDETGTSVIVFETSERVPEVIPDGVVDPNTSLPPGQEPVDPDAGVEDTTPENSENSDSSDVSDELKENG